MKKFITLIAIILLIPILISQKPPRNGDKPYVEGQIMIQLRSDTPNRQQQMLREVVADFQSVNLAIVEKLSQRMNIFLLGYDPGRTDDKRLLEEIKAHPNVELAQFNHYIQQRDLMPSDEFFGLQWNMHNTGQTSGTIDADIDGPEAWDLGTSGVTASGDTIIVAIVDDGFDIDHEDIVYWKNYHDIPGNGIDDDNNGYIDDYDGWNSWTNTGEIIERDHGTHVTGIAAAQGNNSIGVTGVNMHVKVMPVVGSATVESIVVAGYAYVLEMRSLYNETGGVKGAFIVSTNASFGVNNGQPEDYPIWGAMYDSLGMQGVLSAAATANANLNVDEVGDIPTAFPSDFLITVTNTDNNDVKSSFAAYGQATIDLGAPGTQIYSTRQTNSYGYKTGTSMASPHVAGAVAYMFSVACEEFMTAYHNDPAGMALVIKQYILDGVDPLPSLEGITVSGGRLNIYNAALYITEMAADISSDHDTICAGESVQLTSDVIGGAGNHTYSWTSEPAGFISTEANITVTPEVTTTYYLEVTNGLCLASSDSIKIIVNQFPEKPVISAGPASVDNFFSTSSIYSCTGASNAVSYQWFVAPAEAGTTSSTGSEGEFTWAVGYTGTVLITVMSMSDCGNSELSDAFTTQIYSSEGLNENSGYRQLIIYPNPAREVLKFALESQQSVVSSQQSVGQLDIWQLDNMNIEFYNISGILIKSITWPKGQNVMHVDIGTLKPGIYMAEMKNDTNVITSRKFVVIR